MKIIVVGGVAGGATAVARIRRLDEQAEIILIERGEYVSFANCGLPYYIGGIISERDALFVSTKEDIEKKYNVQIRCKQEVIKIDRDKKELHIKNLSSGKEYTENYDKLLLSTGSRPFVPSAPGIDAPSVFTLWTIPDTDRIYNYIKEKQPKTAIVVGGGFIGLEMAENLVERGINTTIVEMANQLMPPLDKDMAKLVENHLQQKGVRLILEKAFAGVSDGGKRLMLNDGSTLETDMTLLSIGVRPNSELANDAGLSLSKRGGIIVDEYMQSSDPNIYAVGDVIQVLDYVTNQETMIPLAGPANKQGRHVAKALTGKMKVAYKGTIGTSIAKVFDLDVASCGVNEKTLEQQNKQYGKDYFISLIHPMSHASYYPAALPMTIKLIFGKDRKVLGAQIVGYDGVDKRIDTIATTIYFKGTIDDLANLELAYAPPYSSAKDPVNFAGFVAENILDGLSEAVLYREWKANPENYQLIDIREDDETIMGALENAIHIPLGKLRDNLERLDKNKAYLVYCAVGLRGYIAERILKQNGFKVKNLLGGYRTVMDMEQTAPQSMDTFQDKLKVINMEKNENSVKVLNVCGLSCPGPIVQVSKAIEGLKHGDVLEVVASDPGFSRDIEAWAKNTGNILISKTETKGEYKAKIQKATNNFVTKSNLTFANSSIKEKTMIVFDGDLDRAIAAFIIATGAASMGNKVHMFFTFWGLSILRKENPPKIKKSFIQKMFATMLPKSSKHLKLSHFNFAGMGAKMIRKLMEKNGVTSLEDMIKQAIESGVTITACQMSMELMGLSKEELIDGVEVAGVASMLADNDRSNMNLFI